MPAYSTVCVHMAAVREQPASNRLNTEYQLLYNQNYLSRIGYIELMLRRCFSNVVALPMVKAND